MKPIEMQVAMTLNIKKTCDQLIRKIDKQIVAAHSEHRGFPVPCKYVDTAILSIAKFVE